MLPEWKKILIIKLRAIGDVILTTPVFRNLREQFSDSQIDFIVEEPAYPLVSENSNVDNIFIAPSGKTRNFKNDRKFIKNIRQQKYDVCIDLFGNPRSALITLLSGAKLRIGFNFRIRKYAYHVQIPSRADQIHEVEFNLDALRYFDIPVQSQKTQIFLQKSDIEKAQTICKELNFAEFPVIALNPSASWPAKKWPLNHFAELAKSLIESFDIRILVLWGPGEFADARTLVSKIGKYAEVHPATGLAEQAALLSICDLYIGNDTSLMHMAAALEVPAIGIFGPTNAGLQGPYGVKTKAVFNPQISCLGCDRLTCPLMDCMNYLKPETIFDEVKNFVDQGILQFKEAPEKTHV